jgi:hypothetical protein
MVLMAEAGPCPWVTRVFKVHENPKWRKLGEIIVGERTDQQPYRRA